MKNIVSFDTAKRLKEAGFPQPDFNTGQFWYTRSGGLVIIGLNGTDDDDAGFWVHQLEIRQRLTGGDDDFFATTATDILEQLTDQRAFHFMVGLSEARRCWQCICFSIFDKPEKYWFADGPAEAAALAWLEIHEKK